MNTTTSPRRLGVFGHAQQSIPAQTISQEERAAAAERARVRCGHAAQSAVGRLRGPQSVFHPLHRTPSRPEMRRSITHGRFSPTGRKLWRRSDGIQQRPRTGQVCLRAVAPASRIPASHAENFVRAPGNSTAGWSGGSLSLNPDSSWSAGTLEDGNQSNDVYCGNGSGARLAPTSCAEPSPREQKQIRQRLGGGLKSDRSSVVGVDAVGNIDDLLRGKSGLLSDDQNDGVIPIPDVGRKSATMDSTSDIGSSIARSASATLDTVAHEEQDGQTQKTQRPVDDGRRSGDSILPAERFATDRRKDIEHTRGGSVDSGDNLMKMDKGGENGVASAVEESATVHVQGLASPSPVRCQRYHVMIPWNGRARETESAGSDYALEY